MNSFLDDERLDKILRNGMPALPDAGFSNRVLAALPETPARQMPWRRSIFCILGAVSGCGFAFWRGVSGPDLLAGMERIGVALVKLGPSIANPLFGAAVGTTMISLLVVFRAELRGRLLS